MSLRTNEAATHTEGAPWKTAARCATYEEADRTRKKLVAEDESLQVKVHMMGPSNKIYFAVKTRVDPELQRLMEEMFKPKRKKSKKKKR